MIYHTIIIGGGPAGLMASNVLEKNNINYLLLEKNEKCGKKSFYSRVEEDVMLQIIYQ